MGNCNIEKVENVRFSAARIQNNIQTYFIYVINYIFMLGNKNLFPVVEFKERICS